MKLYDVLKEYYSYEQLSIIPRMFKKIELIGQEYINVYETQVKDERECFKIIAELINRPDKSYKLPKKVLVSEEDTIEQVAKDMFKIIDKICKEAKTADIIMRSILSYNDYLILVRALEVKSFTTLHCLLEEYYYDEQAIVLVLEDYFEEEINFNYKKRPKNLSLQNIVNSLKKAIRCWFYKNADEETKTVMNDIRRELIFNKS